MIKSLVSPNTLITRIPVNNPTPLTETTGCGLRAGTTAPLKNPLPLVKPDLCTTSRD